MFKKRKTNKKVCIKGRTVGLKKAKKSKREVFRSFMGLKGDIPQKGLKRPKKA